MKYHIRKKSGEPFNISPHYAANQDTDGTWTIKLETDADWKFLFEGWGVLTMIAGLDGNLPIIEVNA